jgi:competence protein ComEA
MDDKRKLELAGWALAAFVAVFLASRLPHHGAPEPAAAVAVTTAPSHQARPKSSAPLVVDVEGEVARPGLQRVPPGSRAGVAVTAAGGLTRRGDATAVNLAAPLRDGQQIVVPRRGASAAAVPAAGGPPAGPSAPISLSSATVAQLDTLDGIGPTLAQRIVQYRDAHGGFRSVDELKQVEGIGEKRFAALRQALQP